MAEQPRDTELEVMDFLREHPDFFERHPGLLEQMRIPHGEANGCVSLIERQVERLRESNRNLHERIGELVEVARENERVSERMHGLALELMGLDGIGAVVSVLQGVLRDRFDADLVSVCLISADTGTLGGFQGFRVIERGGAEAEPFAGLMKKPLPRVGHLRAAQKAVLFAEQAEEVRSAVLVPLGEGRPSGLLAVGSFTEQRFLPTMGTVFLKQLGELVSRALRPYYDADADRWLIGAAD
jgi:uncharacterized protein YigA (DUF484 family)